MQLFGPGGRALMTPRLAALDDAIRAAATSPTRIVGNGAKLIEAAWPANEGRPVSVNAVRAPDIAWVARLGAAAAETAAGEAGGAGVRPLYLRGAGTEPQQTGILPRR